jgi:hypothetical protein
MRRASTLPMRGSDSISPSLATSMSTIARGFALTALTSPLAALSGSRTHRSAESFLALESTADLGRARRVALRRSTDRPLALVDW